MRYALASKTGVDEAIALCVSAELGAWENNIDKLLSVLSRNAQVV